MIVVDSSVVVDVLSEAVDAADLRRRLAGEQLHAPVLLDYEVVSAARRLVSARELSEDRVLELLDDLNAYRIRRWAFDGKFPRRAYQLRHTLTAYDASYIALAEALECPLVTRDGHLARSRGHAATIELH